MQTLVSELTIEEGPLKPEFAAFLEKITWGTEGALYSLQDYAPTLQHLPNPQFFAMKKSGKLIALRMMIDKQAQRGGKALHCIYHSMFAVDSAEKGKGYGRLLAKSMLDRLHARLGAKGLIYSHVEADNRRSMQIHQSLGYQTIGKFFAMTFSRLFPKPSPRLFKLRPDEQIPVLEALSQQYSRHALTDFALSLSQNDYYVIKDNDNLIAGIQVLPQRWIVRALGGAGGALALHGLPYIPIIRKLFNPKDFRFLKLGNLFFREGQASVAHELVEAVLAKFARNTAMMFWDHRSPVYQQFAAAGPFGLLNAVTETPVQIMGQFHNFEESEITDIGNYPACISPIDL